MHLYRPLLAASLITVAANAQAVTDQEFNELKTQFQQLADTLESNSTSSSQTTVGGYGELHYNNLSNGNGAQKKSLDFHRFVLFFGHEFNQDVRFFSELELEHAFSASGECDINDANADNVINANEISCSSAPGEVELEQAYVQLDLNKNMHINAGVFLIPVGIMNETHEPPAFYGTERNPVEKNIIPATWWEAGAMLSANTSNGISYDIALTSGLDGGTSIRGGRQKAAKAKANNLALTGRIKYTGVAGLELAGTVQLQDDMTQDSSDNIDGGTLIETHAIWNSGPLAITALYARWDIDGTGAGAKDVQDGAYVEASYKMTASTGVFIRQNVWDNGGAGDTEKTQTDIGFNYWPHEDVVFKVDYQAQDKNAGNSDGINVGIGYQF